ncbi:MAG: glycosyltransferase family 4 protein [Aquihabitans sp.]
MIINFSWPSSAHFGGGVVTMYEYANAMARRGHEVNFVHGPKIPDLIRHIDELHWFSFEPSICHYVADSLDDPRLPAGDVYFADGRPRRLGQPLVLIQGYKLMATRFERPAYRAACPKLCVASWLIDIGTAWGSPAEQMMTVPIGMDHEVFRPTVPLDQRPVDVAMLYTPHPVKGGDDGLDALELIHERFPKAHVELFGVIMPERRPPDWVTFHLGLTRERLASDVYNRAKVFLQPSWREGFGLTSIEAMACGAALVSTDNGGSRDYALHGETALVIPPHGPQAMADTVSALLEDPTERIRLAIAGQQYVRRFNWDAAAIALENHMERYLADPARYQKPPADAPIFLDDSW